MRALADTLAFDAAYKKSAVIQNGPGAAADKVHLVTELNLKLLLARPLEVPQVGRHSWWCVKPQVPRSR
jgi:hypothetical protein